MKFNNKKELNIEYQNEESFFDCFTPAKNHIPQWYKDLEPAKPDMRRFPMRFNAKSCMPFLDSLTSGYMFTLPFDIAVEIVDGIYPRITWGDSKYGLVGTRDGSEATGFPIPVGYHETHFVWETKTSIKVPKGYSTIITHPFNRFDLPFITLTGVPDSDFGLNPGNIPFYLKKDFEGVIKKGTPYAQVIPFKRNDWKAVLNETLYKDSSVRGLESALTAGGWYKKNFWKKKNYN